MTAEPVTAREFEAAIEALQQQLQAGFAQVNGRLDKVNGRVGRHDDAIAELRPVIAADGVRLKNLERHIFQRPSSVDVRESDTAPKKRDTIAIEIPMNAKTISVLLLAVAGLVTALITLLVRGGA